MGSRAGPGRSREVELTLGARVHGRAVSGREAGHLYKYAFTHQNTAACGALSCWLTMATPRYTKLVLTYYKRAVMTFAAATSRVPYATITRCRHTGAPPGELASRRKRQLAS
jgi:hypothetical protein